MSSPKLLIILCLFRISTILIVNTSFVPDEYWQSMEVAHNWSFCYGYITWEWDHKFPIRSPIHALIFHLLFSFLKAIGFDKRVILIYTPRIFHAICAGIGDFFFYRLSSFLSGSKRVAECALFHHLCNWFLIYCSTRSLINNFEWILFIIGLCFWPHWNFHLIKSNIQPNHLNDFIFIAVSCISVIMRPPSLILWFPFIIMHLCFSKKRKIFLTYLKIGASSLFLSVLIERYIFGRWTCSQINFLLFNFIQSQSDFYGVQPIHWYISNAIPSVLGIQLIWIMSSFMKCWNTSTDKLLIGIVMWIIFCYSLIGHKEHRFILPIIPILMYLSAKGTLQFKDGRYFIKRWIVVVTLLANASLIGYFGLIHQRGTLDMMKALGHKLDTLPINSTNLTALFLMPCHSCPGYSFLHSNKIKLRMLDCAPNLNKEIDHVNEADIFYSDPLRWLKNFNETIPTHVFLFDSLLKQIPNLELFLNRELGLHQCAQFWHAHFPTHSRHSKWLLAFCSERYNL